MEDENNQVYPITMVPGATVRVPNHRVDGIVWVRWPNGREDAVYRSSVVSEQQLAAQRFMTGTS